MIKWIVLDEINLKLQTDKEGNVELFDSKEIAILKAKCDSWQVIQIPFGC
jgi:hypothetical protein